MPNHNLFFVPGDDLTDDQRQQLKDLEQRQHEERNRLLDSLPKKAVPEFMNPPFVPYEDRVLIFPDTLEVKTNSGIIVPDSVQERMKPLTGTVVKVGPGKPGTIYLDAEGNEIQCLPLNVGERIYYGAYAGTELSINGIDYLIMRFADCFGRVE
jgi:chaperonin GroES